MKIYTKTGDEGTTSLFAGGRVSKNDARLHAYGTIDELNSILGVVLLQKPSDVLREKLLRIQSELFRLGADLATPLDANADWITRVDDAMIARLEAEMDVWDEQLEPLQSFILPGGSPAAAHLHHARTVCRRAERWMASIKDELNPPALIYTNRLSDWLFVAARIANADADVDDVKWQSR